MSVAGGRVMGWLLWLVMVLSGHNGQAVDRLNARRSDDGCGCRAVVQVTVDGAGVR